MQVLTNIDLSLQILSKTQKIKGKADSPKAFNKVSKGAGATDPTGPGHHWSVVLSEEAGDERQGPVART